MSKQLISRSLYQSAWLRYVVIFLIVAVLELVKVWRFPQQVLSSLVQPLRQFSTNMIVDTTLLAKRLKNLNRNARRIQDLERELAFSEAKVAQLQQLELENQLLKEKLNMGEKAKSQILSFTINSFARPAIAAGSDSNLKPGMSVLINGTLVGLVDEVYPHYAFIKLLKDFTNEAILVKTTGGVEALVRGDGRRILLSQVTMTDKIDLNDKVSTLGQPGINKGLMIGKIVEINRQSAGLEQQAVIEQLVNFYQVSMVEVLLE